jgi:hypothetical protein
LVSGELVVVDHALGVQLAGARETFFDAAAHGWRRCHPCAAIACC